MPFCKAARCSSINFAVAGSDALTCTRTPCGCSISRAEMPPRWGNLSFNVGLPLGHLGLAPLSPRIAFLDSPLHVLSRPDLPLPHHLARIQRIQLLAHDRQGRRVCGLIGGKGFGDLRSCRGRGRRTLSGTAPARRLRRLHTGGRGSAKNLDLRLGLGLGLGHLVRLRSRGIRLGNLTGYVASCLLGRIRHRRQLALRLVQQIRHRPLAGHPLRLVRLVKQAALGQRAAQGLGETQRTCGGVGKQRRRFGELVDRRLLGLRLGRLFQQPTQEARRIAEGNLRFGVGRDTPEILGQHEGRARLAGHEDQIHGVARLGALRQIHVQVLVGDQHLKPPVGEVCDHVGRDLLAGRQLRQFQLLLGYLQQRRGRRLDQELELGQNVVVDHG